jgi:hypothetical protein
MDHKENIPFPTVTLLVHAYLLLWEHVYQATAQKCSLFTESPLSKRYICHNALNYTNKVAHGKRLGHTETLKTAEIIKIK